eukprot:22707-Chlamydomonas_euryale.AAC.26
MRCRQRLTCTLGSWAPRPCRSRTAPARRTLAGPTGRWGPSARGPVVRDDARSRHVGELAWLTGTECLCPSPTAQTYTYINTHTHKHTQQT